VNDRYIKIKLNIIIGSNIVPINTLSLAVIHVYIVTRTFRFDSILSYCKAPPSEPWIGRYINYKLLLLLLLPLLLLLDGLTRTEKILTASKVLVSVASKSEGSSSEGGTDTSKRKLKIVVTFYTQFFKQHTTISKYISNVCLIIHVTSQRLSSTLYYKMVTYMFTTSVSLHVSLSLNKLLT